MATKFVTNLDLNQNQILNGRFEVLATDPGSGNFNGRVYYNSTEGTLKYYYIATGATSGSWRRVTTAVTSSTPALVATESNGTTSLSISNATQSASGLMSSTDKAILDTASASNVAGKIVVRNGTGDFAAGTITATLGLLSLVYGFNNN